jgi:hypothetical protein
MSRCRSKLMVETGAGFSINRMLTGLTEPVDCHCDLAENHPGATASEALSVALDAPMLSQSTNHATRGSRPERSL